VNLRPAAHRGQVIAASSKKAIAIPFTPFHFGPAFLAKGCFPNRYWITPFVLANVLIDCEVLYCLRFSLSPIHRYCHTYIGGTVVGGLSAVLAYVGIRTLLKLAPKTWFVNCRRTPRRQLIADSAISGLVGGISHVFLDSLMHRDMHPFWPFANGNALAGIVGVGTLHLSLAASGFFGVVLWLLMREP
jgi:hypothetical protein